MIAVYLWCDGFGNDGYLEGIYDSVETARKHYQSEDNPVYFNVVLNTKQDFDYYRGIPLF